MKAKTEPFCTMIFRIEPKLAKALKDDAEKERTSMNHIVVEALKAWLEFEDEESEP